MKHPLPLASPPRLTLHLTLWLWGSLLTLLLLRLSMTEEVYQPLAELVRPGLLDTPAPNLTTTIGLSLVGWLLAALTAWTQGLSRRGRISGILVLALLGLALIPCLRAANTYQALGGWSDLALGLLSGWIASVVGTTPAARRWLYALLMGVLLAWSAKGFYQRAVEIPTTIEYYQEHKAELNAAKGWKEGDPSQRLFEGRMNSQEVTGFLTFSNILAEALLPLLLLCAALAWQHRSVPLALLLLAGLTTLYWTQSKGAAAALGLMSLLAVAAAGWSRRRLIGVGLAAALLIFTATLGMGLTRDALPTRSLNFRWHYWTATSQIIRQAPLGVGLHQFGSYYLTSKRASAPEDVKDPHQVLLRLAVEAGLPAMAFWIFLVACGLGGLSLGVPSERLENAAPAGPPGSLLAMAFVPWILRLPMAESWHIPYLLGVALCWGFLSLCGTYLAWPLVSRSQLRGPGFMLCAGLVGMLLYDQINVALVTGSAAMLFWVLLGSHQAQPKEIAPPGQILGGVMSLAGLCVLAGLWWPLLQDQFSGDPRPAIRQAAASANPHQAIAALDEALRRDRRNTELRRWKLKCLESLQSPPEQRAALAREILALNPCHIRLHLEMAGNPGSGLTDTERHSAHQRALWLNQQLEANEPLRLPQVN